MKPLPEMEHIIYVVPGETQCRVVHARQDMDEFPSWSARDSYRKHPMHWAEVGLVNYQGKLVYMDASIPASIRKELEDSAPLMGGLVYVYTTDWREYQRG